LLAGLGGAVLILRRPTDAARWRATLIAAGLLAAIGVGGSVRDALRPYRDDDALWARKVVNDLLQRAGADPVVVINPANGLNASFHWQLGSRGPRVCWVGFPASDGPAQTASSLWTIRVDLPSEFEAAYGQRLTAADPSWRCTERQRLYLSREDPGNAIITCTVAHWERGP
jgi:hypothetical protein